MKNTQWKIRLQYSITGQFQICNYIHGTGSPANRLRFACRKSAVECSWEWWLWVGTEAGWAEEEAELQGGYYRGLCWSQKEHWSWGGAEEWSQLRQEGWAVVVPQNPIIESRPPREAKGGAWTEPLADTAALTLHPRPGGGLGRGGKATMSTKVAANNGQLWVKELWLVSCSAFRFFKNTFMLFQMF